MLPAYTLGETLIAFTLTSAGFMLVLCVLSWLVRPIRRRPDAEATYECGIPAEGEHRGIGFQYLHYAILFLVFDLAGLYLFLYVAAGPLPLGVTASLALGLVTLGILIMYATRKRRYHVA